MIKKCIKIPFNEEVTGKPGASVRFVEQQTVPLDTTVKAAVDGLFVIGQPQLVKNNFLGLFKSISAGVQRDGKPRKIADFLRIFPVFTGTVDLDKGYDPKENGVYLAAELLNEMKLDISKWTFEDVTEGRKQIVIESITGSDIGVVEPTRGIELNGRGFASTHTVELQLEGGEIVKVDPAFVSGDVSRLDIAAEALAPFNKPENDGKSLTITVRGNFAKDSKTATLSCTIKPKILSVLSEGTGLDGELTTLKDKVTVSVEGCSLRNAKAQFILRDHDGRYMASTDFDDRYHYADFEILSDTQATYHCRENGSEEPDGSWAAYDAALQIKLEDGTILEKPVIIRS